jgi:transcriptional regulator with XRE-family HTH domain
MLNRSVLDVKPAAQPLAKFGRNLARVRSARGLTQEELAESADIHSRYLQKLEAGVGHPSLVVLCRLVQRPIYLGVRGFSICHLLP